MINFQANVSFSIGSQTAPALNKANGSNNSKPRSAAKKSSAIDAEIAKPKTKKIFVGADDIIEPESVKRQAPRYGREAAPAPLMIDVTA